MKRRAAPLLILALLVPATTGDAAAWTGPMDARVAREAVRLMPRSLRGLLETHEDELNAGLREAAGDETSLWHRQEPDQKGPGAAAKVEELASGIVAMIDSHRPFADVVHQMGVLAHFIGDLNNPLQVSSGDPGAARYAGDYAEYVESNLERFPLVFYGWKEPALDAALPGGARQFAEQVCSRARRYSPFIGRAYAPNNPEPLEKRFDVRSLPFGIGSISYSRSVTDTAKIWLHVWRRAHGDLHGTPYLARDMGQTPHTKVIKGGKGETSEKAGNGERP